MSQTSTNEEVFPKQKENLKVLLNSKLNLIPNKKKQNKLFLDVAPVVLLKGMAGSGKTLVACQAALDLVFKKEMDKIIITRTYCI